MVLVRGFRTKANRMSLRLREQLGLREIDAIDLERVCEHFEIALIQLSRQRDEQGRVPGDYFLHAGSSAFSAMTMSIGPQRVIVHNDAHSETRQRSNIAHELAHCFLGHEVKPPFLDNGDRDRNSETEAEATFLGGAILLPNEAAKYIVRSGMDREGAAGLYGISRQMLDYRIAVSGATLIAARSAARSRRGTGG